MAAIWDVIGAKSGGWDNRWQGEGQERKDGQGPVARQARHVARQTNRKCYVLIKLNAESGTKKKPERKAEHRTKGSIRLPEPPRMDATAWDVW